MRVAYFVLAAGLARAAPNLVERASVTSCAASSVVSVLNLLSTNAGATYCNQLLDTVETTQTATVTSTVTDSSYPVTTSTTTMYDTTTTVVVGGSPQVTVMKRFIEVRQERQIPVPSYLSGVPSSVVSQACSCFTPVVTTTTSTTTTPPFRTAVSVATITSFTTEVATRTTTIVGLQFYSEVYGPSLCMPSITPSASYFSTAYTDPTGPDAVNECLSQCFTDVICYAFMVYHTDTSYTCVKYSKTYPSTDTAPATAASDCTYTAVQVWNVNEF